MIQHKHPAQAFFPKEKEANYNSLLVSMHILFR